MNILVQVKEGNIEILEAVNSAPSRFRGEPEAARYLAQRVAATDAPVAFHVSCMHPAEHGLPAFSKAVFAEDVKDHIYQIQQASRSARI